MTGHISIQYSIGSHFPTICFYQVSRQSFFWYRPVFELSWHQAASWQDLTWHVAYAHPAHDSQPIWPYLPYLGTMGSEVLDGVSADGISELLPLQPPPVPTHFATLEGFKAQVLKGMMGELMKIMRHQRD